MFFDYMVTYVLMRRGVIGRIANRHWFDYLGRSSGTDQIEWWREMDPMGRFQIRLIIFCLSLLIYFKEMETLVFFYLIICAIVAVWFQDIKVSWLDWKYWVTVALWPIVLIYILFFYGD
jgi:hypothetical protein